MTTVLKFTDMFHHLFEINCYLSAIQTYQYYNCKFTKRFYKTISASLGDSKNRAFTVKTQ